MIRCRSICQPDCSADCLPVGQPHDVEVVVPFLLDVRGGEARGAQRLLGLVVWGLPQTRHDERRLKTGSGG